MRKLKLKSATPSINRLRFTVTPSVLRLQKWFFNQNGEEFNHKSKSEVCNVWLVAGWEQEGQKLEKRCS